MRYKLADDARPQAKLLIIATLLTVAIWFIPYAEYLVYPIRLFVTFIHESSHALVAVLTGGAVQSLTISSDGSGVVYSAPSGFFGQIMTSSAGYLGTTIFGVFMLWLIRKNVAPHKVVFGCGVFIGLMTLVFGVFSPIFHFLSLNVPFSSVAFTVVAGLVLAALLLAISKFASERASRFIVGFLAVQCLMNALSDLKVLFFINAPLIGSDIQTDAGNMAAATGIPSIVWVVVWIAISVGFIALGIRMYTAVRSVSPNESVFIDH